jgi:hypothetical protein
LCEDEIETALNEQMHVIRHQDVTAQRDVARLPNLGERNESIVNSRIRQDFPAVKCVERYEIERRIVTVENALEPRGRSGISKCRGACAKRLTQKNRCLAQAPLQFASCLMAAQIRAWLRKLRRSMRKL